MTQSFKQFLKEDYYDKLNKDIQNWLKQQTPEVQKSMAPYLKSMMQDYDMASKSHQLTGQNFQKSPEFHYLLGLTGQLPPIFANQQWFQGNTNNATQTRV